MIGYTDIKEIAKTTGDRVTDLIALAPQNDPFYAAMPSRKDKGEWIAALWSELGVSRFASVHLRRVHYWLISQQDPIKKPNGEPYSNTQNDWQFLVNATLAARYLGLVPTAVFVDRRNPEPRVYTQENGDRPHIAIDVSQDIHAASLPDELEPPHVFTQGINAEQPNMVEIWVEKATVDDVLEPIAKRHGCNLVVGVGEESETACRAAIDRARNGDKPMRILYISDFDPGGRSMLVAVARKIEYWLCRNNLDQEITLEPIALLPEQVAQYSLPREPIKETERRAGKFEERFGQGAVELDALEAIHPGELARITEEWVTQYLDPTLKQRADAKERELDQWLESIRDTVTERYASELERIQERYEQLRDALQSLDDDARELWGNIIEEIKTERLAITPGMLPQPHVEEPTNPLFDSRRNYLEQLDHYKIWKNPGG